MQTKKSFFNSKGFYIAIILSVVSVTVATYVAINMTVNNLTNEAKLEENLSENSLNLEKVIEQEEASLNANNDVNNAPFSSSSSEPAKDSVNQDQPTTAPENNKTTENNQNNSTPKTPTTPKATTTNVKFILPIKGNEINSYSNGELIKSVTLNEWRTHDGIDLLSEVGTPVKSAGAGTVKDSYIDPLWGNCVIISHANGVETHYYNLGTNVLVTKGQKIKLGDVIGSIGTTAEIEAALQPHVHFAAKKDDKWIDPNSIVKSKTAE